MSHILTVAKQVFMKNIKSWGFYLMVFGPVIFMVIVGFVGSYMNDDSPSMFSDDDKTVALVTNNDQVYPYFESLNNEESPVSITDEYSSVEDAVAAYDSEDIDGIIEVEMNESDINATLHHNNDISQYQPVFQEILSQIQFMNRAAELELSQEEMQLMTEPVMIAEEEIETEAEAEAANDDIDFTKLGGAYIVNFVLFIFILFYSSMITEEIATEKGSRVMEVILSSITATEHFIGKLLGLMFTIIVHLLLYVLVGTIAYFIFVDEEMLDFIRQFINFQDLFQEFIGIALVLSVIGLILYAVISAFLGSLATKTEDANKVMSPLIMVAMLGFYLGLFAMMGNADNALIQYGSYIPFWTPLVMPFRIATNSVGTLELWLAIGGTALFTVFITWLSLLFYRSNVLVYSSENIMNQLKRSWSINQSNRKAKKS